MALILGPEGELWDPGRIKKTRATDFPDGALPTWLTLGSGSDDVGSTYSASSLAPGGVEIVSDTASGKSAELEAEPFELSDVAALRITAAFTGGGTPDANFWLGAWDAAPGGAMLRAYNGSSQTALLAGAPAYTEQLVNLDLSGATKRFVVSIMITPADGGVYVGDGNVISAYHVFDLSLSGVVYPRLRWIANTSAGVQRDVHQLAVEKWWR